jgi:hypothetical protein
MTGRAQVNLGVAVCREPWDGHARKRPPSSPVARHSGATMLPSPTSRLDKSKNVDIFMFVDL